MEYLEIEGGKPLCGQVRIQGSKNAALPILSAAILNRGRTVLHHCPRIQDVKEMCKILTELGCRIGWEGDSLWIQADTLDSFVISKYHAEKMRSSITLLGSLLGRLGQACIPYPGGCVIGERPIDLHLKGLEQMGVQVKRTEEQVEAQSTGIQGARIFLSFPSVGATENLLLAAVLAQGTTWIEGAAREPEILELCRFLEAMGACIEGAGESCIRVMGVKELHDAEYTIASDRIVAGTYLMAAAACGGEAALLQAPLSHMQEILPVLRGMGASFTIEPDMLVIRAPERCRRVENLHTAPYPGFATDMQSPLLAALCRAEGTSRLTENVFEARFKIVEELQAMGAQIHVENNTAVVQGVSQLQGCNVEAKELRGGAALCIAAASARGTSRIYGCQYIFRGYEDIIGDLKSLGIVIQ
ncbi:MAG: UDP-N-acetylglucosamine 1-carboxyvinyltransferase [Lachnospiraceae bacterium]|nr:UDP-N-acetylglucosamine 1-carboxyvinyltransferase [Lachnospiraceae bacterium]